MKLIGLIISRCFQGEEKPLFLTMTHDVSSFSIVQRNAVKDVSKFLARNIIPKVGLSKREVIAHEKYLFIAMRWSDGLAVSMFTDSEYPPRVAFQGINKIHEDFRQKVPEQIWAAVKKDLDCDGYKDTLREWLKQYSDPKSFDAVSSTQGKVDETKAQMQRNLNQVLGNMQNMEQLMEKSDDLSANTQQMFKQSKKMKKGCCNVM